MLTSDTITLGKITYPYVIWDNYFSENELSNIEQYCCSAGTKPSEVINFDGTDAIRNLRKSKNEFHYRNNENQIFFDKLLEFANFINNKFYGYDLLGFDFFQYSEYNEIGSHYDYHIDMILGNGVPDNMHFPRKLSFSLILSDEKSFDGGEFEIKVDSELPIKVEQRRGRIIAFPSFLMHRVAPLKSGCRKSIVFWATGPKFK